jgi:NADH:ubiquinone oxidoreductase subunit E
VATVLDVDQGPAEGVLESMRESRGGAGIRSRDLIPLLQKVQNAYGYLPPPVLGWLGEETGIPASQMYGVITFYSQFYLEPHGKHVVRCCKGTACHVRGGNKVLEAVANALGIGENETTEDMNFSFETVACLGACALAPVAVIDDKYYGKMTAQQTEKILSGLAAEEE